ncbi:beta-N-acetylhexosaminidase [Streptomyces sp. NPDC051940]|uniref:beta-N-acetylhexosaminidase n=1 Tax=Streptomyces sp. NPDC051940 TaxID=3155675 RepID=UPI00341AACD5
MRRTPVLAAVLLALATTLGAGVAPASAAGTVAATGYDRIVPAPVSAVPGGAPYEIAAGTVIRVPAGQEQTGGYLAGLLRPSTGYPLPVTAESGADGIRLVLDGAGSGPYGEEGYRLDAGPGAVTITAYRPAGLFHGVQTLRQLLPSAVEAGTVQPGPWTVPGGTVTDRPRFAYRGAHLDVSRHFFSVAEVKRYIDQLALYKINYLHLHLSDDQGWRIAIDSWPRLATYGGSKEVGGGPGGYYTQADYTELVGYAADRQLTVVPEIDMPGHTNAALASYAELNCDGRAPRLYTGIKVGFSSLCVPLELTYSFVDDVVREIAALTPGPYIHIGGDEASSTSHADYVTFMGRVQPIVAAYGKTVLAWHQITEAQPAAGAVAQYWGLSGSEPEVIAAANAGTRFVLSPANKLYLDMKYDRRTRLGQSWAGFVDVRTSYDWDPGGYLLDAPASAVYGVEAPLWSETLETSADIEYMAFPRLAGAAELGWSPAATHDWEAYRLRLAAQGPRWTQLGINYYRAPEVPWE